MSKGNIDINGVVIERVNAVNTTTDLLISKHWRLYHRENVQIDSVWKDYYFYRSINFETRTVWKQSKYTNVITEVTIYHYLSVGAREFGLTVFPRQFHHEHHVPGRRLTRNGIVHVDEITVAIKSITYDDSLKDSLKDTKQTIYIHHWFCIVYSY